MYGTKKTGERGVFNICAFVLCNMDATDYDHVYYCVNCHVDMLILIQFEFKVK